MGSIMWALFEINNLLFKSILNFFNPLISLRKIAGSITTPFPIILIDPWLKIPDGIVWSTCLCPSNSIVCPALGPPWNLAIIS